MNSSKLTNSRIFYASKEMPFVKVVTILNNTKYDRLFLEYSISASKRYVNNVTFFNNYVTPELQGGLTFGVIEIIIKFKK
jgi:hypothetical protein